MPGFVARLQLAWTALLSSLRPEHTRQVEAWRARRAGLVKHHQPTYDSYPDQEHRPRMRLVILAGKFMETVDLDGYSLNEINLAAPRWREELSLRVAQARHRIAAKLRAAEQAKSK
jgi:hypothetical protein